MRLADGISRCHPADAPACASLRECQVREGHQDVWRSPPTRVPYQPVRSIEKERVSGKQIPLKSGDAPEVEQRTPGMERVADLLVQAEAILKKALVSFQE